MKPSRIKLHFLLLLMTFIATGVLTTAFAQTDSLLRVYRAALSKAASAPDPTAARIKAFQNLDIKLYIDGADKNLPVIESTVGQLMMIDFPAAAQCLLGSYYSTETVRAIVGRLPAGQQAAMRQYSAWYSADYTAQHSNPPTSVPYPADLPPRGVGWGGKASPAAVAAAPQRAVPHFTANDLEHRLYGYTERRGDNTSRIIIVRSQPEKSCFDYQSGTQWAYFKVLQPTQLWNGDQVWWQDTLQIVSIYDTANITIGSRKYALKDMPATVLTVREFRLSPDYHDVKCSRCNGRGAIEPDNKDRGVSYGRGSVRAVHTDRHADGSVTTTTEYNSVITGSTLLPSFTCPDCKGRGRVHQRDYTVEYRP